MEEEQYEDEDWEDIDESEAEREQEFSSYWGEDDDEYGDEEKESNDEEEEEVSEETSVLSNESEAKDKKDDKELLRFSSLANAEKYVEMLISDLLKLNKWVPQKNGKIYFIYSRVSEKRYKDSLYDQVEMLKSIAEKKGITQLIVLKEKESWHKKWRKLFNAMINKLEEDYKANKKTPANKVFGWILFWKVDRLSRNYGDFEKIEKIFDWWYELISSTETMEATYTGRLLFRILSSFAIYESDKNSARQWIQRIIAFVNKKLWSIWAKKRMFGYVTKKNELPKIKEDEADIVKYVFEKYMEIYKRGGKRFEKGKAYQEITSGMSILQQEICIDYLTSKKRSIGVTKLIEEVLEDKRMISYSGLIRYKVDIKDALVAETSQRVHKENKQKNVSIRWELQIWWRVYFFRREEGLSIIPSGIIKEVAQTRWTRKPTSQWKIHLFWGILRFSFEHGKQVKAGDEYRDYKKGKNYYGYRWNEWKHEFSFSEYKIEQLVATTQIIKSLPKILDDEKRVMEFYRKISQNDYFEQMRSLWGYAMYYQRRIKQLDKEMWMLKQGEKIGSPTIAEKLEQKTKEIASYRGELINMEKQLLELEEKRIEIIEIFKKYCGDIKWKKVINANYFSDKERLDRKLLYRFLFKKILITENEKKEKTLIFEIHPEIVEKLASKWIKLDAIVWFKDN